MEGKVTRAADRKYRKRKTSFTEALKEKYCVEDEGTFDFIIVSPRKRNNAAELAHLQTVVLNDMGVMRADIPRQGLSSLCPNVVDLDLANNLLEKWTELLAILSHLPKVKYVNVSRNKLRLDTEPLPDNWKLSVENLALNDTGTTIDEVVRLSKIMPVLKELHLCGNNYDGLANVEERIEEGAFSTLECLRLNNNRITDWKEIWKLRYLPLLKYIILSGNPIEDMFYEHDMCPDCCDDRQVDKQHRSGPNPDVSVKRSSNEGSDCHDCEADDDSNGSDVCDTYPTEDVSLLPTNPDMVDILMDSYDKGPLAESEFDARFGNGTHHVRDSDAESDEGSDTDDDINDELLMADDVEPEDGGFGEVSDNASPRPVSRFSRHNDTISGGSESDSESEQEERKKPRTKSSGKSTSISIQIPSFRSKKHHIPSSDNLNNCDPSRRDRHLVYDDDDDIFISQEIPVLADDTSAKDNSSHSDTDNPTEHWPRLAAQAFLNDLINNLEFPETIQATSSLTAPLSGEDSLSKSKEISEAENCQADPSCKSTPFSGISSSFQNLNVNSTSSALESEAGIDKNTDQIGYIDAERTVEEEKDISEISVDFLSILEKECDMADSSEENVFAKIYSDNDFIPRAVSLAEGDCNFQSKSRWLPGRTDNDVFTPNTSRARRVLFNEQSSPGTEPTKKTSPAQRSHFSPMFPSFFQSCFQNLAQAESDSCSECESEQHSRVGKVGNNCNVGTTDANLNSDNNTATFSTGQNETYIGSNFNICQKLNQKGEGDSVKPKTCIDLLNANPDFSVSASRGGCVDNDLNSVTEKMLTLSNEEYVSQRKNHDQNCPPADSLTVHSAASTCQRCKQRGSRPFHQLQMLCLSNAGLSHPDHLKAFMSFPKLNNIRLKNNPLYSAAGGDDKRKLYIASLPRVTVLNGSEVSQTEREKAERHFLRYFMDKDDKPEFYNWLVKKHGPPVKLVDIDLGAGYQEWANLNFVCDGKVQFSRKIHLVEPVARLRTLIAMNMGVPKRCFVMYHHSCGPSHPESERELVELRCENLPMSRFDFAEGDEIHVDIRG